VSTKKKLETYFTTILVGVYFSISWCFFARNLMGLTYKQDVFSSHRNSTLTDQNIDSKSWVALIHQSLQGTLQDGFVSPKMFVSGPTKRFANLKPPIPDRPGGDVPIKAKGLHSSPQHE
jgi:hypothetical protein